MEDEMLNQDQRDQFRNALALENCCGDETMMNTADVVGSDEKIVATHETMDDFFAARGRTLDRKGQDAGWNENKFGRFYRWEGVQQKKGLRRGTLYVMDFGDVRACYFDGETE